MKAILFLEATLDRGRLQVSADVESGLIEKKSIGATENIAEDFE